MSHVTHPEETGIKMHYTVKKIETIGIENLTPHPDALAMGASEDDRGALDVSIDDVGMLEPLTVIANDGGHGWLVIDGVGRLTSASEADCRELDCLVVECSDVRTFVGHKNAMGRKRSTGSRVLCYILANASRVMGGQNGGVTLHETFAKQEGAGVDKHLTHAYWSAKSIASRLKVSRKDVGLAIELLVCQQLIRDTDGKELEHSDYDRLLKVFNAVMSAELPIRRWKAAFAGALGGTQPGTAGRAVTDYVEVGTRAIKSLCGAWKNWKSVPVERIPAMRNEFRTAVASAPECMRYECASAIVSSWSEQERRQLLKEIKASL